MLDADAVHAWCRDALDALGGSREEIDALNVYPVPDGDTGTNLFLTMEAALDELEAGDYRGDLGGAIRAVARGALIGAHGNSGTILSQLLRGAGDAVLTANTELAAGLALARGLAAATNAAYAAVAHPVEGTMLTVIRAAADAAADAAETGSSLAGDVARAAADAASSALVATPDQLAVLARAGVVDAGGRGVTVLLDVLARTVSGRHPINEPGAGPIPRPRKQSRDEPGDADGDLAPSPQFEVMYLLEAADEAATALRDELEPLGDSLLVAGGEGLWNIHIHVNDPGPAIEAGTRAGRPYRISVTDLRSSGHSAPRSGSGRRSRPGDVTRVVVALAAGPGLARLAADCGAVVLPGGPDRRATSRQLVTALHRAGAQEAVLVPDDAAAVPVAEAAAESVRADGIRVAVLPSRAAVQVLAALAVHDPGRQFEDDVVSMTAAARATRTGSVSVATTRALTSVGVCAPGDVLGIADGDVVEIGTALEPVAQRVLERMLSAGGELVTLVVGNGASDKLADRLRSWVRHTHPAVEVTTHDGGQDRFPLLVGVE